jgi:hypothetical protein
VEFIEPSLQEDQCLSYSPEHSVNTAAPPLANVLLNHTMCCFW